ncbi:helix-turn-helix transcriptional regulator [Plantactinospora sp. S1510]|uniref:Helix-turn-helix transcriptional regulator n=1 Tax=Plantactinospora alkalitolerans TaxID=2789879 RepID=A0ABS0H5J2_9ACTN|nr:helix-turn-helix transcriptional regulator [Plantactinospora alkalitolerans]MBF9133404.1 helix-turn-helix transcriptional regulator [Plantactinospora alkalitolerans]
MGDLNDSMADFIVEEIRRARCAAGMTQEAFGKGANCSASLVSAVENGTRSLTSEYVHGADRALRTGGLFWRLVEQFGGGSPVWFREWVIKERTATSIRWYESCLIPGLLQTEAYARAVLTGGRMLNPDQVEQLLAARLERQAVLARENPPQFVTVLDAGVLRRPIGGPVVMREQLDHLLSSAEQPQIHVHVVPAEVGYHAGLAGSFILMEGTDYREIAHVDSALRPHIVAAPEAVAALGRRWESLRGEALPRTPSIELMKEVAKSWI